MGDRPFLTRFPKVAPRRPDLFEAFAPTYSIVAIDIRDRASFDGEVNSLELAGARLTYARYGSPVKFQVAPTGWFWQGIPISGAGEAVLGRHSVVVDSDRGGLAAGPGTNGVVEYGPGFSHLSATFSPESVARKLATLLGRPVDRALEIDNRSPYDPSLAQSMARLVRFFADELDRTSGTLPPMLRQEMQEAILVAYLLANRSNYSAQLHRAGPSVAPHQVRRTVDFLEEHWQEPVTIELLASVAGTSARSLFYTFKRARGMSPMRYLRLLRLRHARELLSGTRPNLSVTWVGHTCGFSNLGYFAREYYRAFGEMPSTTLARSHHSSR